MRDLVLGIDTGGTYTDGVLLDYHSKEVVRVAKALTTHHDLTIGILEAVDALKIETPEQVKLVSISTTLATNSIAEGKGKPVALFLLGYDPELIQAFNLAPRFATPHYFYIKGGHDLYGQPQCDLDVATLREKAEQVKPQVEAIAVSGYFSPLNSEHEEQAFDVLSGTTGLPIVLGHQLATKLDSIERATTATLNASLLAVLQDFIVSVREAMVQRGLTAPLMVVRGDGTLMSADVADRRPVETVHSGPAASAIGGYFLSGVPRALVVDIGGTTTDIALVDGGRVTVREEGTTVGGHRTAVRAAHVRSIGLGGDSHITFDRENQLLIGPQRVVPLAYLAHKHPRVARELRALFAAGPSEAALDALTYWYLVREPLSLPGASRAWELMAYLKKEGPRPVAQILKHLGVYHPLQLGADQLIRQGIIGRAGLTPTDLLHVTGEYAPWDAEVAAYATELVARLRGMTTAEFIALVKDRMAQAVTAEIIAFLTGCPIPPEPMTRRCQNLGRWCFDNSWRQMNPYLQTRFILEVPLIGIGAPAGIFLPRVAEALHTELILPPYYAVANAVGAVAGSVVVTKEARIYPRLAEFKITGYYVQSEIGRWLYGELNEALAHAREVVGQQALTEAQAAGAVEPHVEFEQLADGPDSYRLRARAVGNPRLGP